MELELKKAYLDAYETGGELTLTQEETAETIVPDYCPDIARIIETNGKIYIHSRELRDDKAEVSGTLRATVLYIPEGEKGIRALNFSMPFSVESESRSLPDCSFLSADTEIEFLETRMLNPRKIFIHAKLVTRLIGYQKSSLCISEDIHAEESLCVEKKIERQHAVHLTQIAEKDFTFTEGIGLSPGREGAAELLKSQVNSHVTETKIVGNKLIFKGLFTISLLYRMADGTCSSVNAELPFSQIMEAEGVSETASASLQIQFTGTDFQIDGEDPEGRQIAVTLYLHVIAFVREVRDLTLLNDLYSTAFEMNYEAVSLPLTGFYESFSRRQTVREVLEIGVVAESILSLSVLCGAVTVHREGSSTILRTSAIVRALYLDEGGAPLVAERSMDVNCQLDLPENCRISARAVCTEEVQGSLGDRGIEVRFPVDFRIEATARIKRVCISSAKLDNSAIKDMAGMPSLVLRRIGKQETAWDLAKRYNTTIHSILAANELEEESDISKEKLLLIPRKRA